MTRKQFRIGGIASITWGMLAGYSALTAQAQEISYMEGVSDRVQARLESQARAVRTLPAQFDNRSLEYVLNRLQLWNAGQSVTVAFLGGTPDLHRKIAEAASEWTQYGNIKLDFGHNPATGTYRTWTRNDMNYAADIRIAFDEPGWGYASLIGTDSRNPNVVSAKECSMNFANFHVNLPMDYKSIVLHEFGHALGFLHQHQRPAGGCDSEFRWDDDPGYIPTVDSNGAYIPVGGKRPGIYTVLGGYPNFWTEAKVDRNLRELPNSTAFRSGQFDNKSIMLYHFDKWMYRDISQGQCYTDGNSVLSAEDKAGCKVAYPSNLATILMQNTEVNSFLNQLNASNKVSNLIKDGFNTKKARVIP